MGEIEQVRIRDIGAAHLGRVVEVRGWLRNKPGGKGRYFLWLRDGSGEVQAVAEQDNLDAATWADCERIGIESSLIAQGEVRAHPKQEGVFELELKALTVVQCVGAAEPEGEFPIGKKSHGVEFLMKNRHLWIRGKRQSAILRIRSELHKAISDFFHGRGFYRVDTPIFTPNACEGTTTLFEVDYHGDTVYLAQSGQLYNEADIGALGRVYCFGPTFRAEKSKTRRHLLEFWMLEMEAAYLDHEGNMRFQEELMAYMTKCVLANCLGELRDLERDPAKLEPATETPYPKVRYGKCVELINDTRWEYISRHPIPDDVDPTAKSAMPEKQMWLKGHFLFTESIPREHAEEKELAIMGDVTESRVMAETKPFRWGDDFGAPDETVIGNQYDRPVFVTNFPVEIKGFYFKDELNDDGSLKVDEDFAAMQRESPHVILPGMSGHTVAGSDLIGSEGAGELIGASQREDDIARLEEKIARHKLPPEFLTWYVDLRRYGSVPHSGFGLGLERTIAWLCGGADNPVHLRETIAFPRMLHQFEP